MAAPKEYPNGLRWDLSPSELTSLGEKIMSESKKLLDDIAKIPAAERTFDNTVRAMADEPFVAEYSSCYFPSQVSPVKELREASVAIVNKLEEFFVEQKTREDLYNALKEYEAKNADSIKTLKPEEHRLFEKMMQSFVRNGLALPDEKRKRVKEIKQKLSQLCITFQQNLNEDVTKVLFTKEELEGLPADFIENLPKDQDKFAVSLKYPELYPVLKNCKVEETRKKMRFASSAKCMKVNTPILEEIILLRQEEAKLMGFASHAAYELDVKMAKNADTVFNFLNDLIKKLEVPAQKQIANLLELKKKEKEQRKENFDGNLNIWDLMYYHTLLLESQYDINQEQIKEYFPLEKVTTGLLEVFAHALGMKFVELPKEKAHVWHEDVKMFEVIDTDSNKFMGHLYLDLFPRDGKYGHAAEFDLKKGFTRADGTREFPAPALVCNFNKPTATKPSLLRFDEVVTFFHELGHAVHELCSEAVFHRFSGTNVERDFVEAPSQMLENWCYEADVLAKLSAHYQTGEQLPENLRTKLIAAKNVDEAILNRRQLHFGMFDMRVHTADGPVDTGKVWSECMKNVALFEEMPDTNAAASFGHLAGGYSAGYYGYLWSKVYSCDMFDKFKEEGLLNQTTGKRYRKYILATGGTRDSMDALVDFLGRQPSSDAFLKDIGVLDEVSSKL